MYLADGTKIRDGNEYAILFVACLLVFPVVWASSVALGRLRQRSVVRR